jgi:hypothetical protein
VLGDDFLQDIDKGLLEGQLSEKVGLCPKVDASLLEEMFGL